ncbi:MAG: polyprenyl synthetase family protein, partial [Haloarculaceae archaeon]
EIDADYLADFFGPPTFAYHVDAIQQSLADPIWDLLDSGGKRWRAVLFLVVVEAVGADPEDYLSYASIPEILHNGTIIVDDVEDEASTRRGAPALHHQHGKDVALNAGNALYFIPLNIIARNDAALDSEQRLRAYEMLSYEFNRTHLGQGMDIRWHNQHDITVSEDQYYEMCACKTGCLTRIVARLAAIVTGQPAAVEERLAAYAERMAISFQIADDILDIEHTIDRAGDFGKEFGNDIKEGKKTLMSIDTADRAPAEDVARLEDILWAEDNTEEEVLEAIDIMEEAGAIEYARERAREFATEARGELDDLDLEPEAEEQLRAFTTYVIERSA